MKSLIRLLSVSHLALSFVGLGCSSALPANHGAPPESADGAAAGDDDSIPDAGPLNPPGYVSSTPRAKLLYAGNPATPPDIVIISSNVIQTVRNGQLLEQWYGEIQNNGKTLACSVKVDASFNEEGTEVAAFSTEADGEPYGIVGERTIGCIPPGKIGSFHAYATVQTERMVVFDAVTSLVVTIAKGADTAAGPSVDAPTVKPQIAAVPLNVLGLKGSIVGGAGVISDIEVRFYPRDSTGLVLGMLNVDDVASLNPRESYSFTTGGLTETFAEYRYFVSFNDKAAASK